MRRLWLVATIVVYAAIALRLYSKLIYWDETTISRVVDWNTFREDYQRRYHRSTPDSLKQWLEFANSRGCEPMKFYDAINRDLAVFRDRKTTMRADQVVEEATTYTDYHVVFKLENHKLTVEKWHFDNWWERRFLAVTIERVLRWLLHPLVQHKPPIANKFVFNLHDKPRDVEDAKAPIFSSCHEWNNDNNSTTLTHNTLDLLVPYYMSIGLLDRGLWFWPFYSRGSEWKKRKDTITWRGSTTGHPWLKGHRFRLLELYGGTAVGPIAENVPVNADFAFTNIVQNDGQDLDTKKYRLAKRMSYREMQDHKYVLDVDGNCKWND